MEIKQSKGNLGQRRNKMLNEILINRKWRSNVRRSRKDQRRTECIIGVEIKKYTEECERTV